MGKSGIKKALKVTAWIVGVFLALDLLLVGLLFVPAIQTFVVQKVTSAISEKWGSEIFIGDIRLTPTLKLVAHEVTIKDHHNENMIYSGTVKGRLRSIKTKPFHLGLGGVEFDHLDVVLRTYKGEDTINIAKWSSIFKSDTKTSGFQLSSNTVDITNGRFVLINDNTRVVYDTTGNPGIDYAFFELANLTIRAKDFFLFNDDIAMKFKQLAFTQYGGFQLKQCTGDFHISGKDLTFNELKMKTNQSDLDLDLRFNYDEWKTYGEFLDSVHISAKIRPSTLAMDDIAGFAPTIRGMNEIFVIEADTVDGIVNDFMLHGLTAVWDDRNLVQGDFAIRNVTDFLHADFDADIDSAAFYLPDLANFTLPKGKTIPSNALFRKMGGAFLAGSFKGTLEEFDTHLRTSSGLGILNADIKTTSANGHLAFTGDISSTNFRMGLLTNQQKMLGNCSLRASFEGKTTSTGLTSENFKTLTAHLNGDIQRFPVVGYPLRDIQIEADYQKGFYNASLKADDPNIQCDAIAQLDMTQSDPYLQGTINLLHFDGGTIGNMLPRVDTAKAQGIDKFIALLQQHPELDLRCDNFRLVSHGSNLNNINGYLACDNIKLNLKDDSLSNERLRITAINQDLLHKYILASNIANASLESNVPILAVVDSLQNMAHNLFPSLVPASKRQTAITTDTNTQIAYVKLNLTTYNTRTLTRLFFPNMFIAPNSTVNLDVRSDHIADLVDIDIPYFSIRNKLRLHNFRMDGTSTDSKSLAVQVGGDSVLVYLGKGRLLFDQLDIKANSSNDIIHCDLSWHNPFNSETNISNLNGEVNLSHKEDIVIQLNPSKVFLKDYECHFNDQNAIHIMPHNFEFDNLTFYTHNSAITLNGSYDTRDSSKLSMAAKNIDLSLLNPLLSESMALGGRLSADLNLVNRNGRRLIFGKALTDELYFSGTHLGDLFLMAGVGNDNDIRFTGGLFDGNDSILNYDYLTRYSIRDFQAEHDIIADVTGEFRNKKFTARAHFDSLEVGFLAPFLSSFSDYFAGAASGDLSVHLSADTSYLEGTVHVEEAQMGIGALGTRYTIINQDILFNQEGIFFQNMELRDKDNNRATLSGDIRHKMFKDMQIDLQINTDRILVLDAPRSTNAVFFGTGYVDGDVHIFGDSDHLSFVGPNIRTLSGSKVYLQVTSTNSASETDLIHFQVRPSTTDSQQETEVTEQSSVNLSFDFTFDVANEADIVLLIESLGATMNARADGRFQLVYNDQELNLYGNLLLHSGDFKMSLMDVVNPKFTLVPGGSINFDGPLSNMTVNISAYKTSKTSLSNIIPSDYLSGSSDVKAIINLNGPLMQRIEPTFGFELPNSSNEIRSMFYTAIDTTNTENLTKQFAYFMVTNSFMPENMFAGTASGLSGFGLLSNMVNNVLSNVIDSKKASFGITYNQATETTSAEYGFRANANLLQDRVTMSTSIGYYDDRSTQAALNNIYGDLTVEYSINKSGTWKLKAYTYIGDRDHTYLYENPNLYTAGVALAYKQDFDRVRRSKKENKKRKSKTETNEQQ